MKALFVVIAIHLLRLSHYQDNGCVVLSLEINTTGTNKRALPENIIVGYATHCTEKVVKAVREGFIIRRK